MTGSRDKWNIDAQELITRLKDWVKRQPGKGLLELNIYEQAILKESLEGKTYKEMYNDRNIPPRYACSSIMYVMGPKLFRDITKLTGKKVTRNNCRVVITQLLEENDEQIPVQTTNPILENSNYADFYGRSEELDNLEKWIVKEGCRLVGVFGIIQIGKTALIQELVERIKNNFDYVIWKNLKNFDSLEEVLTDIEKDLSYRNAGQNINRRINNLINYLKQHRCLLIFDQGEQVIKTTEILEKQKQIYSNYKEFLTEIGTLPHRSCLVFISLSKPEIMNLITSRKNTRKFSLAGLKNDDAKTLLQDLGLSDPGLNHLIERYTGHPLALSLAAGIIQNLHNNKIDQYLEGTVIVPEAMLALLDKQFSYLSNLEKDILQKLATEKEPKFLSQILQYFPDNDAIAQIKQAVENLWRILLIEKADIQEDRILWMLNPLIERYIRKHYNK